MRRKEPVRPLAWEPFGLTGRVEGHNDPNNPVLPGRGEVDVPQTVLDREGPQPPSEVCLPGFELHYELNRLALPVNQLPTAREVIVPTLLQGAYPQISIQHQILVLVAFVADPSVVLRAAFEDTARPSE